MMKVTKWFTFDEVLDIYPTGRPHPNKTPTNDTADAWFMNNLASAGLTLRYAGIKLNGSTIKETDVKKYIKDLTNIIYDRQHNNYIYRVNDVDEDYELVEADYPKAMNKFIDVLNLTMPKYIPMMYEAETLYQDLLKKLESESDSFNRYNDTPQNEQDEVDFNSENYATNMGRSKSVTKVDSGSPVARMDELRTRWKSIVLEWSNQFDMIFIDEYQLGAF